MKTSFTKPTFTPLIRLLFIAMALISTLTGCGGGGGGGTPATYTVGGTVSGLSNTGLVLQNNASDDLSISADGSFTFNTSLNTNTAYAITIKTQPIGQTCTVTNGTGTVTTTNINTASVSCVLDQQDAQGLYTSNGPVKANFINPTIEESLNDVKGMIYGDLPNQKFIFFDIATNVLYDGVIPSITLKDFTGTAVVYHDGLVVDSAVTVTGTVTSRSTISLKLAASTSGNFAGGTIEGLFINPPSIYDTAATNTRSIGSVSLDWKSTTDGSVKMADPGMLTSDFSVFNDDTYNYISISFGARGISARCDHNNGILKSGSAKNIYVISNETVTVPVGPCALTTANKYTGFTSIVADDGAGKGTEMWYATTNGTNSIFMILTR